MALCARQCAAGCSCGAWNDAALSGAGSTSSETSGCGGERRGRRFRLRTGLRDFLRLSDAMWCQFCFAVYTCVFDLVLVLPNVI